MARAIKILLVLAIVAAVLQVANHVVVHRNLCGVTDVGCTSVFAPGIEGRWRGSESLPGAVRGPPVVFAAATALIRRKCDRGWTAGFGARVDVREFAFGDAIGGDGACVDAGRTAVSGELAGARVRSGECTLALAALEFDWSRSLTLEAATQLDASAMASCGSLVSTSGEVTAALTGARLGLTADYAVPYGSLGEAETVRTGSAAPALASSWIRSALGTTAVAHTLTFAGPPGTAALRLASTPPPAGAQSPELVFEVTADESVRAALPAELRGYLNDAGALQVRWNMDHESGRVTVNGAVIERAPQSFRGADRNEPTEAECGSDNTAKLSFVEANDEGQGNDAQLAAVFEAVESSVADGEVVVTVFVHGWQHSAAPGDSYVCSFAALIRAVETMEQERARASRRPPRAVLGVYVGWPGALYSHEAADVVTTFWNRLEVADRLGAEGAVLRRLIRGLVERVPANERGGADTSSALVVAGHSLGGRAVYHAVRDDVIARASAALPDLVLLVNPAFSANLYDQVHAQRCTPGVPMLLFSSETDGVTRQVYPAGQALSYPYAQQPPASFIEHIYTAANFDEFVTHELNMDPGQNVPPRPDEEQTILRGFQRVPPDTDLYSDVEVKAYRQPATGRPTAADLWYTMRLEPARVAPAGCEGAGSRVIEVDTRILPNHGEIFTPPFMEYVVRALNASIGRAEAR